MKRFLMWAGIILITPLLLIFLLAVMLYLPPVQDFAVRKATAYVSELTGKQVSIGRLRLSFPLDLDLQELCVMDGTDTLLATRHTIVDLNLSEALSWRVGLDGVSLKDVQVDSKDLIASVLLRGRLEEFTLHDDVDLKEQRVAVSELAARGLDLDVALRDTITEEDTTESAPLEWIFEIQRAAITDAHVRFALADGTSMTFDPVALQADSIALDLGRQHLRVPSASLNLAGSELLASAEMDFDAFATGADGALHATLESSLSKDELFGYTEPWLPADLREGFFRELRAAYPDTLTRVLIAVDGNMDHLALRRTELTLPGSLHLDASGNLMNLIDSTAVLGGNLNLDLQTMDLGWVRRWLGLTDVKLPPMQLSAAAAMEGSQYDISGQLREAAGLVNFALLADTRDDLSYDARVNATRLNLNHFLPKDSLGTVSLTADAKGHGTDLLARTTRLDANARLSHFCYKKIDLSGLALQAHVANGRGRARVQSDTDLLVATADVDALLGHKLTDLTFALDLSRADLYGLGLVDEPLKTAMCLHLDGTTNLSDHHEVRGTIVDILLMPRDTLFRPEDMQVEAIIAKDTTHVFLSSGDLMLTANGRTGYDRLLDQLSHFTDELSRQMEDRRIDTDALVHRLPQIDVHMRSGEHNPFHDILLSMGYGFEQVRLDLNLDPLVGINGGGHIYRLTPGAMQLDTIRMHMYQDSTGVKMYAHIINGKQNPHITFDARLNGYLLPTGAGANLTYLDERGRKGVDLGMLMNITEEGFRLHFNPLDPIIAYRTFHLNESNYVMLGRQGRVSADLDLLADDGTGLKLYSSPNEEALQDLSLALNHFNLGELMTVLPYAPRITGLLQGDVHVIQTTENLSVSTDLTVNNMTFEGAPLGQIGLQAVYLPEADGSHFVDGSLMQTGVPVASFRGSYTPKGEDGVLDVNATLDRLPFSMANGFIPDGMARLEGVAIGDIHVGGTTAKPVVDGILSTNGLRVRSDAYSLDLRFRDDSIRVQQSDLRFDRIEVYSTGANPFIFNGGVNFSDFDRISLDATLSANNFELINAKKTAQSLAYGKVFVDFNAMLRGTLDNLRMFGRLRVLGDTDVTYILTDSPLTVNDPLADLVEFVDFEDSTRVDNEVSSRPQHMNITMNVSIDNAAQIHCLLSPDASSYVNLEGGGDLSMTYSPEKDLQLNGRYTINSGTIKYKMTVIPLREFNIKSGSYVEFRGPLTNPTLNISATERVRTTITENDHPRTVNFDVGLNITQTLENLGLEFTLDAPDDLSLYNELATMSPEQRGRVAVTMLATGMYLNENGSKGFTGQNALNAFLQTQISNLTSKALKSVDLSIGLEQGTSASGTTQMDYSFRFAKRFWGNRVSVIVGGRVSSGEEVKNTGETLIDNVSIEYRLDKSATRYVNLFYDKSYESLLDGEVIEMGAGLVLRRKTDRLSELFLFRNKKDKQAPTP